VLIRLSHPMSEISHVGADLTAFILPDSLHDAEIRGAVPLSIGKKPSLLAGCDNRISTIHSFDSSGRIFWRELCYSEPRSGTGRKGNGKRQM